MNVRQRSDQFPCGREAINVCAAAKRSMSVRPQSGRRVLEFCSYAKHRSLPGTPRRSKDTRNDAAIHGTMRASSPAPPRRILMAIPLIDRVEAGRLLMRAEAEAVMEELLSGRVETR